MIRNNNTICIKFCNRFVIYYRFVMKMPWINAIVKCEIWSTELIIETLRVFFIFHHIYSLLQCVHAALAAGLLVFDGVSRVRFLFIHFFYWSKK